MVTYTGPEQHVLGAREAPLMSRRGMSIEWALVTQTLRRRGFRTQHPLGNTALTLRRLGDALDHTRDETAGLPPPQIPLWYYREFYA